MDLFSSLNSSVWFSVCDKTTKIKTQAGQYPLWPVSALVSIRSGQYPLWPVSAQASIRSGLYPHCSVSAMASIRYGQYPLWPVSAMACIRTGRVSALVSLNSFAEREPLFRSLG